MAKYTRLTVLNQMISTGLVPVFYHNDVQVATRVIEACLDGGARCIEFTNRGDQADQVFGELIRRFLDDDRLILGVGTVLDPHTAAIYIQHGTNFVVTPDFNPDVALVCNLRKVAISPGCASVSEINQAMRYGVEICKVFPGGDVSEDRVLFDPLEVHCPGFLSCQLVVSRLIKTTSMNGSALGQLVLAWGVN